VLENFLSFGLQASQYRSLFFTHSLIRWDSKRKMASATPVSIAVPTSIPSDPAIFEHINHQIQTRTQGSPIYAFLLSDVVLTHASRGLVIARLTLGPNHVNSGGGLHGGVSATLVDWAGGTSIAAHDMRGKTGVSVDIHVEYLASASVGDEVEIEGRADRVGGSLAYTSVGIYRVRNGTRAEALVLGRHTKFVRGTAPSAPAPAPTNTVDGGSA
jgi:acyl-coenzyme A thioesterase 13